MRVESVCVLQPMHKMTHTYTLSHTHTQTHLCLQTHTLSFTHTCSLSLFKAHTLDRKIFSPVDSEEVEEKTEGASDCFSPLPNEKSVFE